MVTCACGCGRARKVREADFRRGWGRYYSKRCKARDQERRTGQHRAYRERVRRAVLYAEPDDADVGYADPAEAEVGHIFESGFFGHGQE